MAKLLGYSSPAFLDHCEKLYKIKISKEFAGCADIQLTFYFEHKTAISITKQISISWVSPSRFFLNKDTISKFLSEIYVNNNWNPVTILWTSKSGRIYELSDTDIDCNDIQFWFEGLDPLLYHRQLYPKEKLPFKLKNLSYDLVINRINKESTIKLEVKPEFVREAGLLIYKVDYFLADFNNKSEKADRKDGVIHNWKREVEGAAIIYEIDFGFTGPKFLKKFLEYLSTLNSFHRILVD